MVKLFIPYVRFSPWFYLLMGPPPVGAEIIDTFSPRYT